MAQNKFTDFIHNVLRIAKTDIKAAFSHPLVLLTLIAIIILPSLYANLNIMACWDPYENTDHMEIAVANLDQAATYGNKTLTIGDEVVKELKKNDNFDWTFVSESDAREGVKSGRYYSVMIIPQNFSSNIASIGTKEPKPAELEYIVNEKANPVASRLSDAASKEVQRTISNHIVQVLDVMAVEKLTILKTALATGSTKLQNGASQVNSGASQVNSGSKKVSKASNEITKGSKKVSKASDKITTGSKKITKGSKKVTDGSNQLAKGSKKLSKGANELNKGVSEANYVSGEVNKGAKTVAQVAKNSDIPDSKAKKVIVEGTEEISEVTGKVNDGLNKLSTGTSELATGSDKLATSTDKLSKGTNQLAQGSVKLANGSNQLAQGSVKLANGSNQLAQGSVKLANGSNQLAQGSVKLANGSNQLAQGSVKLADGAVSLADGSSKLATASANALATASGSLSNITSINKDYLGDYFYSPVILDRKALHDTKHYGSEVAPFYLILSIWVGCIVTCVLIKMRFPNKQYKPIEVYFGKMGFFLAMSLLQTTVTMVWVWSLGVEIGNMALFIFSMYFVGLIFMFLMYSLISIFGLVGEGIAIILLVLQISSTGGIYPVEVMPAFFKAIHPYLPMTYAITMVREACLGLYLPNYTHAISILILYPIIMFIIAVIIKGAGRIDKKVNYVEEKLMESDLFQ